MKLGSDVSGHSRNCLAARFLADQQGVAAVEFVFIFPLMLVLLFGTIQFTTAFAVDRKVTVVARTMSDLISQATEVSDCDLSNAITASKAIMSPYSSASMKATISQVFIDPKTHKATVDWSGGDNAGDKLHDKGDVVTVPKDIAVDGKYLIMSEVKFSYQPAVGFDMAQGFNSIAFPMNQTTFTRPRQSDSVLKNSTSCS
jgi:Flp pilus assembly protein TadG